MALECITKESISQYPIETISYSPLSLSLSFPRATEWNPAIFSNTWQTVRSLSISMEFNRLTPPTFHPLYNYRSLQHCKTLLVDVTYTLKAYVFFTRAFRRQQSTKIAAIIFYMLHSSFFNATVALYMQHNTVTG